MAGERNGGEDAHRAYISRTLEPRSLVTPQAAAYARPIAGRTTALTECGSRPAFKACSTSARPYSPVTRSSRLTRPEAARAIAVGHVLAYRKVPVNSSSRCWM